MTECENTPASVCRAGPRLMEMGIYGSLSERQTKVVQTIERSGQHLLALINDILDYTLFESGRVSLAIGVIAVEPLCQEAMRVVAPRALAKQMVLTATLDSSV